MSRGIIWDLGNVLIDWQPREAIAAGVGGAEADRFLAEFDFLAFNHLMDSGSTWEMASSELRATHPHWLPHATAYREHFPASLVGEVPGTVAILRRLAAAGVPMWGLTNWPAELWPHAPARFPFLGLLRDIVVSGAERVAKPAPAAFALAISRAQMAPHELVFIDDREANVRAAIEQGLDGIVFVDAEDLRDRLVERGLPLS